MRIVIDLQGAQCGSRHRGIGRYSLALAHAMVRNRGDHEIIIALSGLFPDTIEPIRAAFDGLAANHRDCFQSPAPVFAQRLADRDRFCAERQTVTGIFDIGPGHHRAISKAERGANMVVGIGRIGAGRGVARGFDQAFASPAHRCTTTQLSGPSAAGLSNISVALHRVHGRPA